MNYLNNVARSSLTNIAACSAVGYGAGYVGGSLLMGGSKLWIHLKGLKDTHGMPLQVHDFLPFFGTPKFRRQLALAGLVYFGAREALNKLLLIKNPNLLSIARGENGTLDPVALTKIRIVSVIAAGLSAAAACLAVNSINPSSDLVKLAGRVVLGVAAFQIVYNYIHYTPQTP